MIMRKDGGALFRNRDKKEERHPDYKGDVTIDGKKWALAGWLKDGKNGKYLSLAVSEPRERDAPADRPQRDAPDHSDIPF